jgi:hypothetical protein
LQECNRKAHGCEPNLIYNLPLYTHKHTLRIGGFGTPLSLEAHNLQSFPNMLLRIGTTAMNGRRDRESE